LNVKTRSTLTATILTLACLATISVPAGAGKLSKMDMPVVSCAQAYQVALDLLVCGGATTGAPAGFTIHWMTADQYNATGWLSSDQMCGASLSGNANGSAYNLGPNQCVTVNVGNNLFDDPGASSNCADQALACGTTYAFRAFAHANSKLNRSDFTPTLFCTTQACEPEGGCTYTQGYWKNHNDTVCLLNPTSPLCVAWPVTTLTLGNVSYSQADLLAIFNKPAAGNGLISLAHQLIAAKLNVASGADDTAVAGVIVTADALIGNLVVPPVGSGSLSNASTSALTATLTAFNEGTIGPGHCE
jgi:hypothetical protein